MENAARLGKNYLDPADVECCFSNVVFDVKGNIKERPYQIVIPDRAK